LFCSYKYQNFWPNPYHNFLFDEEVREIKEIAILAILAILASYSYKA